MSGAKGIELARARTQKLDCCGLLYVRYAAIVNKFRQRANDVIKRSLEPTLSRSLKELQRALRGGGERSLSGGYDACGGLWHRRCRWIFRGTVGAVRRAGRLRCARRTSQGAARQWTAPRNTQGRHRHSPGGGHG